MRQSVSALPFITLGLLAGIVSTMHEQRAVALLFANSIYNYNTTNKVLLDLLHSIVSTIRKTYELFWMSHTSMLRAENNWPGITASDGNVYHLALHKKRLNNVPI